MEDCFDISQNYIVFNNGTFQVNINRPNAKMAANLLFFYLCTN